MSGGSFDYIGSKYGGELLEAFFQEGERMVAAFEETVVKGKARDRSVTVYAERPVTELERAALDSAGAELRRLLKIAQDLEAGLRAMHGVMHKVEWRCSGDGGHDNVVEECLVRLKKLAGLKDEKED